jgi:hypothetical protein
VGVVNFAYLEGFLGGDKAIAAEVLQLFRNQSDEWNAGLVEANAHWREVVHAIKGAARGVGANALGDACQAAEFGVAEDLPRVLSELAAAMAEIDGYLAKAAA